MLAHLQVSKEKHWELAHHGTYPTYVKLYKNTMTLWQLAYMKQLGTIRITPYTIYSVRWGTYFLVIRVEHQKLNQTTAELSFG